MKNNQALIEYFLEAKFGEEGLSENTILAYSRDLEQICKKVGKSLVDVSQSDLEQYFIYLKNSGHSKSTTARRLSTIKQFYKFHVEKGFLSTDPTAQLTGPRLSKPLPKTLSVGEVEALLQVAKNHGGTEYERVRNRCLMEILYASGMRISELMSLPVSSV